MSNKTPTTNKAVALISLGCDKNRIDTENMLYEFLDKGYTFAEDKNQADVIVVNTCAFIGEARREAINTILEAATCKQDGICKKLIVTGCLSQKYAEEIAIELPEVDAFLGVGDYGAIERILSELFNPDANALKIQQKQIILTQKQNPLLQPQKRILTTPSHFAYLRVSDGCNNKCSFCTIPSIRGNYISRTIDSLVDEAKFLIDSGASEIILVAQDTTNYGFDLSGKRQLLPLLDKLTALDIKKIRLMYCYPHLVSDDLIDYIASNEKLAKYIDMPLQHVGDRILKLMHRPSTYKSICNLFNKIKSAKTHIAVRTTFMVGFPTETDDEFNTLYNFTKEFAPDHVGIFSYSKEDGTPAAKLKGQVHAKLKKQRHEKLAELHYQNVLKRGNAYIGKTLSVVYEGIDFNKNLFYGRTEYNAPDVDTQVYFTGDFCDLGQEYNVTITGTDGYDLVGKISDN